MEDLPADIKAFLMNHPFFEFTDDGKKVRIPTAPNLFSQNIVKTNVGKKGS